VLEKVKNLLNSYSPNKGFQEAWEKLRQRAPVPVVWLFGKTQSGKTSIIKFLTGADEAEIGQGFKPCTRFSRQYQFPTPEAPLLTFLDTPGLDDPGYDPAEDLARFDRIAHVLIVTVKVMDHAQGNILKHLQSIRHGRPTLLALTCLHEAYPQQQHPQPYPFGPGIESPAIPEDLRRSLEEQRRRFGGLYDQVVPIDLTGPEEGFAELNYGGERFKQILLDLLPSAYRHSLMALDQSTRELQSLFARRALPHIAGYSTLAATAGAIPIPWLDLLILPGIQTRMIYHLAQLYGQPMTGARFLELASTLGLGLMVRQATREVAKVIPVVGSVAGGALAGASTFALGKAFCYYFQAVHQGHVPKAEDLRRYYHEQLTHAEKAWTAGKNHKSEARDHKSEARDHKSEARDHKSEARDQRSEVRDQGLSSKTNSPYNQA
jgi:uncharacterized protein (DUF697 family)